MMNFNFLTLQQLQLFQPKMAKDTFFQKKATLNAGGKLIDLPPRR
jgi:hypothetical protein